MDFNIEELTELKRAVNDLIKDRALYILSNISQNEKDIAKKQMNMDYILLDKILKIIKKKER